MSHGEHVHYRKEFIPRRGALVSRRCKFCNTILSINPSGVRSHLKKHEREGLMTHDELLAYEKVVLGRNPRDRE